MADDPALRAALVARGSAAITALLELHGARLGVTESALLTPEFGASVADAPILRQATDVVADSVDPRPATRETRIWRRSSSCCDSSTKCWPTPFVWRSPKAPPWTTPSER